MFLSFSANRAMLLGAVLVLTTTAVAEQRSVEEIAADLANPNTPLASLNFKLQFRTYEGDLPGAHEQESTTLLFQPSFPFPLASPFPLAFT